MVVGLGVEPAAADAASSPSTAAAGGAAASGTALPTRIGTAATAVAGGLLGLDSGVERLAVWFAYNALVVETYALARPSVENALESAEPGPACLPWGEKAVCVGRDSVAETELRTRVGRFLVHNPSTTVVSLAGKRTGRRQSPLPIGWATPTSRR